MDQQAMQVSTKNLPRFSIIIIGYNIEDYITRAIESAENQDFENKEIIVVNDCSTDSTESKILECCEKYKNIQYIKHEVNKKAGGARNTGLKIAKGEYIVFLDGDDYLAGPTVLTKLDEKIGKDKTDVIYLGFKIEGDREELVIPTEETCTKNYKAAKDKYPNPWSKCWRSDFLKENNIKFKEGRFYEDVLFVYQGVMLSNSYKIADYVTHIYTSGRVGSMTTKMKLKNIEDTLLNIQDLAQIQKEKPTPEAEYIIEKEKNMCKKRLQSILDDIK